MGEFLRIPVRLDRGGRTLKKFFLRGAFVLLGLALAAVGLEAAVWFVDPFGAVTQDTNGRIYQQQVIDLDPASARLWSHKPDLDVGMRGFRFRTDVRGLRRTEADEPADARRLLFLGDSVVLGWGVAAEDTFVEGVEELLEERTGDRWDGVNSGHLMYDSTQELALLEQVGLSYEPELAVLVYVDNDIVLSHRLFEAQATGVEQMSEEAQRFMRRSRAIAKLHPYMPSLQSVLLHLYVRSSPAGQTGTEGHAAEVGLDVEQGWEASRAAVLEMARILEEAGIPFAVLDLYRGTELSTELERACREAGIPHGCIAFTPEEQATGVVNSAADGHPNPRGHDILARNIVAELERLELLD